MSERVYVGADHAGFEFKPATQGGAENGVTGVVALDHDKDAKPFSNLK